MWMSNFPFYRILAVSPMFGPGTKEHLIKAIIRPKTNIATQAMDLIAPKISC